MKLDGPGTDAPNGERRDVFPDWSPRGDWIAFTGKRDGDFELKSSIQMWDGNAQQCEIEQADLETQFRAEQAKMNDLQDQLDKLDRLLAGTSK